MKNKTAGAFGGSTKKLRDRRIAQFDEKGNLKGHKTLKVSTHSPGSRGIKLLKKMAAKNLQSSILIKKGKEHKKLIKAILKKEFEEAKEKARKQVKLKYRISHRLFH